MIEAAPKKLPHGDIIENQAARYEAARRVLEEEGISIKHFRLSCITPHGEVGSHTGGITVAYRQLNTDSFVEISTAICSKHDIYNRKVGTILAVEQFMNMRRIRVPAFGGAPSDVVEALFRDYTTFVSIED